LFDSGKRKKYCSWSKEDMLAAIKEVQHGHSLKGTAKKYGIPRTTLRDKVFHDENCEKKMGRPVMLSRSAEDQLVAYAIDRADKGIGLSKRNFLR
jgi:hypothetical protein